MQTTHTVPAERVHDVLARSILADGYPFVYDIERSHGSWLVDARTGDEYLDAFSFFASAAIGHNHAVLRDPAFRERLLLAALHKPSNSDVYTTFMADFVDAFSRLAVPPEFPHLFFIEGGAPAVENALKAAFDWKVRRNLAAGNGERGSQIIHFTNAFHGRLGYTLSLTNTADPRKYLYYPRFDWPRIPAPMTHFPLTPESLTAVEAEEAQALADIRGILERDAVDVAAIIVEPIQAEGGDNHLRPEFLQGLRGLADEFDVLLIFDEIQTGMGITGSWWLFQQLGVAPDIFSFGKKAQVCGIAASRRLDEVERNVFVEPSRISSTWGGNLTDMVRGQAIVETIANDDLLGNARRMGARLLDGITKFAERAPIDNVRGRGLMIAFDLGDTAARDAVLARALDERLIVLPCGRRSVRLRPYLTITEDEATALLERLGAALGLPRTA
ncbi:MAG TPA: L-lysine 6-transaminase [Thermomicrobiaceae bacterium]|nr:L-lysine 6-transaminase [Thermomicrobiaceae bacterium]